MCEKCTCVCVNWTQKVPEDVRVVCWFKVLVVTHLGLLGPPSLLCCSLFSVGLKPNLTEHLWILGQLM